MKNVIAKHCKSCKYSGNCPLQTEPFYQQAGLCPTLAPAREKSGKDFSIVSFMCAKDLEDVDWLFALARNIELKKMVKEMVDTYTRRDDIADTIRRTGEILARSNERMKKLLDGDILHKEQKPYSLLNDKPRFLRYIDGLSYDELLSMAFNPEQEDLQAQNAQRCLIKARKRGGDLSRFTYSIQRPPYKGSGCFHKK